MAVLLALGCVGCATYSPLPLGNRVGVTVGKLGVPISSMPVQPLSRHRFDPSDGLDVTEVAMLAVANNPQLKVKRDALGVARAQAFAAGLLPDPKISAGMGYPTSSGSGLTSAFNFGISEDISALLTRSTRTAAAREHGRQVNLELLWAEWQTIARARLLFDQVRSTHAREQLLQHEVNALTPLDQHINQALEAGNLTYAGAASGLDAMSSARRQLAQAVRQHIKAEHGLRQLLGLSPGTPLHLVGAVWQAMPGADQVQQALATLSQRRPDLLALKAGYAAQEARVRGAILAQFPAITLGFTRARDTSNIYTSGFSIGITLPLFNRNRGNIAIARATRKRLHDAYSARLLTTRNDMDRLQQDLASLGDEIKALAHHAGTLDAARASAVRAWQAGMLDWPTYLTIRNKALAADLQLLTLRQQRDKQAIALETLLGGDWNTTGGAKVMAHATSTSSSKTSP
ncbi:MAG TPA: TolC family protein [Oleiagrimonas sp.]|nr:TolC family protein [Oleiagrimonas sp.]